jgi:hypothetical protein
MEGKLERLIGEFPWGRTDDVAAAEAKRAA